MFKKAFALGQRAALEKLGAFRFSNLGEAASPLVDKAFTVTPTKSVSNTKGLSTKNTATSLGTQRAGPVGQALTA